MRITALLLAFILQVASEPYPGQSGHAQPPDGWVCLHQDANLSVPAAHVCSCEKHCDENGKVVEDRECAVWCWGDHCHCEMSKGAKAACH